MAAEGSLRLSAEWFEAVAVEEDADAAKKVEAEGVAGQVWESSERAAEASGGASRCFFA